MRIVQEQLASLPMKGSAVIAMGHILRLPHNHVPAIRVAELQKQRCSNAICKEASHQEEVVVGDFVAQCAAAPKRDDGHQREAPGQPERPLVVPHIVLQQDQSHFLKKEHMQICMIDLLCLPTRRRYLDLYTLQQVSWVSDKPDFTKSIC